MHAKKSLGANSALQNVRAKKALGQNFLTSNAVAKKLVDSADIVPNDIVVEVGPGKGIITKILLQKTDRVIAVEKDGGMIEYLKEKFSQEISSGKLTLVHDDILNFSPSAYRLEPSAYKLVGAIPYYITGAFLKYFLQTVKIQPSTVALIVQKEVALRLCSGQARSKKIKESILSISVKAYGTPVYVEKVPRKLFSPEPNVDSAIIVIKDISKKFFDAMPEEKFFAILKAGFAHKRKMLKKNLKTIFTDEKIKKIYSSCGISLYARAENLSLGRWGCIATRG